MYTFEGVTSALDDIAGILGTCTIYERIYDTELDSAKAVFDQLTRLYTCCLHFMAKAIEYFKTSTASGLPSLHTMEEARLTAGQSESPRVLRIRSKPA